MLNFTLGLPGNASLSKLLLVPVGTTFKYVLVTKVRGPFSHWASGTEVVIISAYRSSVPIMHSAV